MKAYTQRRAARGRAISAAALAAILASVAPLAAPLATPLAAQESGLMLGGTLEARPFARYATSSAASTPSWSYGSVTALDLEMGAKGEHARAAASVEASLATGAAATDAWAAAAAGLGTDALFAPAYGSGSPVPGRLLSARIRLLYAKLDYDAFALTAGRQVVNYAKGSLWSPTDLFTELDLTGLSPLRRGTDALRLALPLGATGALDLVAAPDASFSSGRYAARLSGFITGLRGEGGIDGSLIACRDGSAAAWDFGADFKTDLIAGIDGEALYSLPDSGSGYLLAAGGSDYSFGDFVVAAQYYYNGGGAAADGNAPGAHNAYAALSWKASDFVSLAASCVAGLSEKSCVALASVSVDAAQNAELLGYAKLAWTGALEAAWSAAAEAGLRLKVKF